LRRWTNLLRPGGRLVLIEGRWDVLLDAQPYGGLEPLPWAGGLSAERLGAAVAPLVHHVHTEPLTDPALWGRPIHDERYVLIASL
jgi:hypothetical protein